MSGETCCTSIHLEHGNNQERTSIDHVDPGSRAIWPFPWMGTGDLRIRDHFSQYFTLASIFGHLTLLQANCFILIIWLTIMKNIHDVLQSNIWDDDSSTFSENTVVLDTEFFQLRLEWLQLLIIWSLPLVGPVYIF